ncbi:hypothetical protein RDI58_010628 [Solanum bulbocastanum]|uniref:Uncharacterized protein n=1 Tax=Solanum bulbocastanum TaxID=147425 RepID=A0AAN8YGJ3_SOLBU
MEIDNVLDVAYQNDVAIVQQQVDVELETTLQHPQQTLEEVSDDEILNVKEEISENAIRQARPLSAGTPSPIGTSPQLSAMRIGDSSSKQLEAMAGMHPLTQSFVHLDVSPSPTATPSSTMPALAPGQKDSLGRVLIELDGSSKICGILQNVLLGL